MYKYKEKVKLFREKNCFQIYILSTKLWTVQLIKLDCATAHTASYWTQYGKDSDTG